VNPEQQGPLAPLSEQAFIAFAGRWNQIAARTDKDHALSADADAAALACLLLASERGARFCGAACKRAGANLLVASSRFPGSGMAWIDSLPWRLCQSLLILPNGELSGAEGLLGKLNHPMSAVRSWMMSIAWAVHTRIPVEATVRMLLRNVANTLQGVSLALGLARGLCASNEEFEAIVRDYSPPGHFDDQFHVRISHAREIGFYYFQIHVWDRELRWRGLTEEAILGL